MVSEIGRIAPIKIKGLPHRFGLSQRKPFLMDKPANALHPGQLVRHDSAPLIPLPLKIVHLLPEVHVLLIQPTSSY